MVPCTFSSINKDSVLPLVPYISARMPHFKTHNPTTNNKQGEEKMSQESTTAPNRIAIHRIYTKNHQFMVQLTPDTITQPWLPQMELQANPRYIQLDSGNYEVTLALQIKAQQNEQGLFEAFIEQAGLFTLEGIAENQRDTVLYGACPNLLFPYATATLNLLLSQAALPPVYLAPLDFVALHAQHQKQQASAAQMPVVKTVN